MLFFFKSSCAWPRLYFLFIINKFFFYNWCNVMYYCPCLVTSMKPPSSLHWFSSLCFISKILELSSVRSRSWICLSSFNTSLSLWILLLIGVPLVEDGQIILQYSTGSSWIIKSWIFLIFNLIKAGGSTWQFVFYRKSEVMIFLTFKIFVISS